MPGIYVAFVAGDRLAPTPIDAENKRSILC
jgi:hypothetical protein